MRQRLAHHADGRRGAPALVLLHAIGTNSDLWLPQLGAWSARWRVIRIDLPGHGASAAPVGTPDLADYAANVRDVLDELEVDRAALVGLSLGGMVAQAFALAYPQRTAALVLAHTTARTDEAVRELWQRRLEHFEAAGLQGQVAPALERWFTRAFAEASPLTLAWIAGQICATSPDGYTAAIRAIQRLDHLDRLGQLTVPTLVIAGEADSAVPPAAAAAMAAAIPGSQLVVLPESAHLGNVQQPVRFTEVVGSFLGKAWPA
jgi:3-oxoadipate enol-lactonase